MTPSLLHYWMKDTEIPLDIIWINAQQKIIDIAANTPPCEHDPCQIYTAPSPAQYVLEVNAGFAQQHHIQPGMRVS
ncbi:DUF192 domain-containing protein, partial [Acinetobacter baumannii]